jgi:hypothetical protein
VYETVLRGSLGVPPPGSRGARLTSDSYIGSVTEPSGEVFAAGGVTCVTSPNEGDDAPNEGDVDACGSRARGAGSFGVDEENADEGDADEGDADECDAGDGSASEAVSGSGSRGGP